MLSLCLPGVEEVSSQMRWGMKDVMEDIRMKVCFLEMFLVKLVLMLRDCLWR